jgi:chromosome segregation ATPase
MHTIFRATVVLSLTVILGGCAVDKAGCDPKAVRDSGLMTKMNCQFSGSYDARAADQDEVLRQKREENANLRQAFRELDSANDLVKLDISARKAKLDSITKSVDSYLQQIKTSSVTNASLQARVAKAQAMTDSIKSNPPSDVAAVKKQLDAVQAEITAIQKEKALIPQ